MEQQIKKALQEIEEEEDVLVLSAHLRGSQAKGLADYDSDYDVMFLFVEEWESHVSNSTKNVIDDDYYGGAKVDLHGWSLQKFTGADSGLLSSNPMALEIVDAPKNYYLDIEIAHKIESLFTHARDNFKPYALIRHQRSKAASNYGKYIEQSWTIEASKEELWELSPWDYEYKDDEDTPREEPQTKIDQAMDVLRIGLLGYSDRELQMPLDEAERKGLIRRTTTDPTVKRHLFVLDALFRARYVEHGHKLPPVNVDELLPIVRNTLPVPVDVVDKFEELAEMKRNGDGDVEIGNPLGDWIETELDRQIDAGPHVKRRPDRDRVRSDVHDIVTTLANRD